MQRRVARKPIVTADPEIAKSPLNKRRYVGMGDSDAFWPAGRARCEEQVSNGITAALSRHRSIGEGVDVLAFENRPRQVRLGRGAGERSDKGAASGASSLGEVKTLR